MNKSLIIILAIVSVLISGSYYVVFNDPCEHLLFKKNSDHMLINDWLITEKDLSCISSIKPNKITVGTSSGGYVIAANMLSDYIKENNIQVNAYKECSSACTFLLAASPNPQICPRTLIGMHKPASRYSNYVSRAFLEEHYQKMKGFGIRYDDYKKIIESTPNNTMHYANILELKSLGFKVDYSKRCT